MAITMKDFLQDQTKELTFLSLDIQELLTDKNNNADNESVELPILLEDLTHKLQKNEQEFMITAEILVKGIAYLLGVDPDFKYRKVYFHILKNLSPDITKTLLILGNKTFDQGDKLKGMIYLKAAVTLFPSNTDLLFNYALALLTLVEDLRKNDSSESLKKSLEMTDAFQQEARIQLEKLLEIEPEHGLAQYHLGFLYKKDSLFQKAEIIWKKALEAGLEDHLVEHIHTLLREIKDLVLYEQGYQKILQGESQEGLPMLLTLEKPYPEWWNLHFFIGLGYRQQNQYANAITYFQRVIELEDRIADPYVEIGLCYAGLGKYLKALEYFEKALKKDPDNGEILSNLAMVSLELGDVKKAEKYIEASLRINPNDEITLACQTQVNLIKQNTKEI